MLYAVDPSGTLIEPRPKALGVCSLCKLPLIPKCGDINRWHWSHRKGDCDAWQETETDWHRDWKRRAEPSWCEVALPPHRADIRRATDGLVIELQFSSIGTKDIAAREAFYGDMWWLFHIGRFGKWARFFLTRDEGVVRFRWLNASRTMQRVTKPIFCDLGGPIVEFTTKLDPAGGLGRLMSRKAFLERVGLRWLDGESPRDHSHYEILDHHDPGPSGYTGRVHVSHEEFTAHWNEPLYGGKLRSARRYRLDGSSEAIEFTQHRP